jgi:ribosome-associated protein
MKNTRRKDAAFPLAQAVIKGIQEKKGHDIVCLDLTKINSTICDYFIICHGDSHRQVESISDSIEEQVKKMTGEKPWHSEGTRNAEWVLLDYVNVVAHVFFKETRGFYNLEGLWADAEALKISENGGLVISPKSSARKKKSKNASRGGKRKNKRAGNK